MPKFKLNQQISLEALKKMFPSTDRKMLIQNAMIAAAFAIFIFLFFVPILMQNKKMMDQVNNFKWRINQANLKIARIPQLTKEKEIFGARTKQIRDQFFDVKDADQLIGIISTIAADSGVKISASRPVEKPAELPPPFSQMYMSRSYELIVVGGYHNVGSFINKLEHYSKNFSVHNIQIAGGEKNDTAHQCTLIVVAFIKRMGMA